MSDAPPSPLAQSAMVLASLAVVALAAGLEGGVVPQAGGPTIVLACTLAAIVTWRHGLDRPGRLVRGGLALLGVALAWSLVPIPPLLRGVVAPGQAAWVDRTAPEWSGDLRAWLDALTRYDLRAAIGDATPWSHDVLAGAQASALRPGALAIDRVPWALAGLAGSAVLYVVGVALGRQEKAAVRVSAGLVVLGVAEAIFGIANRNGPSTGLSPKVHYLGSATGTFINRGHFGAFLVLALGAAWGLAAGLFPLQSDEVRRHRQRKNRSSQPPSFWETAGDRLPRLALLGMAGGLISVGIVASQSRGPLLAFGLAAAGIGLYTRRVRGEPYHLGIGLGVPAVAGVLSAVGFGVRGAFGRFLEIWTDGGGVSLTSRLAVWREGIAGWLDAPLFGGGPGSWRLVRGVHEAGAHLYDFQHAHDEIVEQLAELGAVGTAGLALLAVAWWLRCLVGVRTAPHDPRSAVGIGAIVGVVAVGIQSLGDFPLHTPGVALPAALLAGLAHGALTERNEGARGVPMMATAVALAALAAFATQADRRLEATREERVSELPSWFWTHRHEPPDAASARRDRDDARSFVDRSPLDPWGQAALARAEARLARFADRGADTGGSVEAHAFAAEHALQRAAALRAKEPRLLLHLAHTMLILSDAGDAPDGWKARAAEALVQAVTLDSWRAKEAFDDAGRLTDAQLAALGSVQPEDRAARTRIAYEYGMALARRKRPDEALATWDRVNTDDPRMAAAWFQAGVLLRGRHEDEAARLKFEGFLRADDRPLGMEGWALLYLGQLDAAEARLHQVVTDAPTNRWAWEGLAEVAARRGDRDDQLTALRRIVTLAPADPAARERLRQLEATAPAPR